MVIPQLGPHREVLTPHKVSVVILILEYYKKDTAVVWLPKYLKKFGLLLLRLIQNADLTYRDLNNLIKSDAFCLHPQHITQFETYLERVVGSDKEMLFEFHQSLNKFIGSVEMNGKTSGVNESSIVFLYLRRFMIALHRMSLLEEVSLYQAICEYYRKGVRAITLSACDDSATALIDFSEANQQAMDEGRDFRRWNRKQIELFVGQQFTKLEYNESEALSPTLLQSTIDEIIEDNPRYAPAYYLDYLNSLRCGDLFGCLEKLHRCFDVNEQRQISAKPGKGYQYYVLNLATLHARFGHSQLALSCLRDSIMLAQEVGDRECLELASNWRQFLCESSNSQASVKGGVAEGSNSNNSNSNNNSNALNNNQQTTFLSINNQLVAKGCALQGVGARKALQIVSETSFINYNNSLLVASSLALKSAIYNQMGKHQLAALNSQLLLNCPLKSYGNTLNGEPLCKALLNVATWLGAQGHYDQAAVLFQLAGTSHRSSQLRRNAAQAELQVSVEQCLAKRQWEQASVVCQKMHTYDATEKAVKMAKLNVERGNFPTATAIVEKLLRSSLSPLTRTQLELLQLETMLSIRTPNYEFINSAVKALNFARAHNLSYEVAQLEVMIARIHLELDTPTMAKSFIERALLKILCDGTAADQGDALWVYLKCQLLVVPKSEPERICQLLTRDSALLLDVITEMYTKLDCTSKLKKIFQFLAGLCNDFGLREERNRFAFKFKQLVLENAAGTTLE